MKSRIIPISIAAALALAGIFGILVNELLRYDIKNPETMGRAELLVTAEDIEIIDASKDLLYIKAIGGGYAITDKYGNPLADMRGFGGLKQHSGGLLAVKKDGSTAVVNISETVKQGKPVYAVYDEAILSGDGTYMLVKQNGRCIVQDMKGRGLYEAEDYNAVSLKEGYITDRQAIVNLADGRTEYRLHEGTEAVAYGSGFWVIGVIDKQLVSGYSGYYMLDDKYNIAFEGRMIEEYKIYDGYIWLIYEKNKKYTDIRADGTGGYISQNCETAVIDADGRTVYRDKYSRFCRGITGGILAVSDCEYSYAEKHISGEISYIRLAGDKQGETMYKSEDLCYMDFEDGIGAVCAMKSRYAEDRRYTGDTDSAAYKWYFVDENMKRISNTVCGINGATDSGYVIKDAGIYKRLYDLRGLLK